MVTVSIHLDEHVLGYLEELHMSVNSSVYTHTLSKLRCLQIFLMRQSYILLRLEFLMVLLRVQICQCLVSSSPRCVRSQ